MIAALSALTPMSASECGMPSSRRISQHPGEEAVEAARGQIEHPRDDVRLVGDGAAVEGHDVGQNDGIGQAVMGVEPRAHRVRDGMHAAETLLKGGGAHRCGGQHLRACFDVLAVGAGARQVAMDEPHALERDAVRERMESRRAECLEAMDEGVDAGGRGHCRAAARRSVPRSEMTMRGIICGWKMIFF